MKNYKILTSFKNLIPLENYFYQIESINGNWPVTASPASGSFTPMSSDYDIYTDIRFCVSSGNCSGPNLLPYTHSHCDYNNIPFVEFRIKLNLPYSNQNIYGQIQKIECDDCLSKTSISSPLLVTLDQTSLNKYSLITSFHELKPYSKYEYSISLKEANHKVSFNNLSGYFYTKNETDKNIETNLVFCENSGLCEYVNNLGDIIDNDCLKNKFIELSIKLDSDCLEDSIVGDVVRIECNNCLPATIIETLSKTTLTAPSGNVRNFNVAVTGLKPYSEYFYSFNNVNSNHLVGLKQLSGVVKTKNNTSATIANSLIFCESSGYCNSYFTNGSANTDVCNNLLFADFDVELNSSCLSQPVVSDKIHVECDNCLPVVSINTPPKAILTAPSGNVRNFNVAVTGLKPYSEYFYSFNNVNSNHLVGLKQLSGVVKTKNNTSATIANSLIFCESSGYCNSYFTNGSANTDVCNNLLFADFDVELNSSCLSQPVVSDKIHVECDNCIGCTKHSITIFHSNDNIDTVTSYKASDYIRSINDSFILKAKIENLRDKKSLQDNINSSIYLYNIESLGGNANIYIDSISGIFTAAEATYVDGSYAIDIIGGFCCYDTCPGNILETDTDYLSIEDKNTLRHKLRLSVTDLTTNYSNSKIFFINHSLNLDKTEVSLSANAINEKQGCWLLESSIPNRLRDKQYSYQYKLIDSNWPVYLENISGIFLSDNEKTKLTFCPSKNICNNISGVLDLENNKNKFNNYCYNNIEDNNIEDNKYALISLQITSNCLLSSIFESDPVMVYCTECPQIPIMSEKQ
jgi:hypothetical protein